MAGSDDSISSAASSGSDGEQSRPASATSSSRNSSKSSTCRIRRRQNVAITGSAGSVATGTVRHRHRHKLSHRFEFVRTLGCGTYGKVKLAVQLDSKEEVAIKCIPKSKIDNAGDLKRLRQEVEVMSSLRHPHIVRVTEVFESPDKIVIVMEYAPGGELYDYINDGKLSSPDAKKMFGQIVSAVHYLHKNNIVHRDLKLENVLLDRNFAVKIADFGLSSTYTHSSLLDTFCGSPLYASPEIVNGTPYQGPEVDCWSLGVILYAMVYKTMPFQGNDFMHLKAQITGGEFYEPDVPSDASDLIHQMLKVDPQERITVEEILNHPWLRDGIRTCLKDSEICSSQQTEVPDNTTQSTRDGTYDNRRTEAVRKPLTGILKKSLRKSSHKIGSDDSGVMSFSGKEVTGQDKAAKDLGKETEGAQGQERPKAKKGILKKQGKDSGRDSGLGINESGKSKSNGSLDLEGERDGNKEKNKRDSGIDQDLSMCPLSAENAAHLPTCKLRNPNRLNYVCKITRRHSRGKYSKVAKMWESIYATSVSNIASKDTPPKTHPKDTPKVSSDKAATDLEHNSSSSSNEDILGILDSPRLRTPTVTKKFQYNTEEVKTETTVTNEVHATADFMEEESYTRDELVGAMDDELLEVYKKALKISQAVM